eukprot:gene13207-biopygen9548
MLFFPREVGARWPGLSSVSQSVNASKERFSGLADAFSAPEWRSRVLAARIAKKLAFLAPGRCIVISSFRRPHSNGTGGLGWSLVFGAGTVGRRPRRRRRIRMARNTAGLE